MGNLARPGYAASTDGMWPYRYVSLLVETNPTCILFRFHPFPLVPSSNGVLPFIFSYDSCDVGTFPNQTDADGLGPPAALFSNASREMYNFSLSWLPGQRAS
jgi:hypothetical protein